MHLGAAGLATLQAGGAVPPAVVASSAQEMADAILALYNNRTLWEAMHAAALRHARAQLSLKRLAEDVLALEAQLPEQRGNHRPDGWCEGMLGELIGPRPALQAADADDKTTATVGMGEDRRGARSTALEPRGRLQRTLFI